MFSDFKSLVSSGMYVMMAIANFSYCSIGVDIKVWVETWKCLLI